MTNKHSKVNKTKAVQRLAELLIEAAPLVELLNSPSTSHAYRSALRQAVGPDRYFAVVTALEQMCSWRTWELAHGKTEVERQKLSHPGWAGVHIDGDGQLNFYRHGEAGSTSTPEGGTA